MWTIRPVGVILAGDRQPRAPQPSRARVSPNQCRQARDILKWTPSELAEAAGVTPWIIAAFEEGREVSPAHEEAIRTALEAVGIGFPFEIANGSARPAGVTYSPGDRKEGH
jgi:DNA-binding XRE family transcriptional regulator